MKKSTKAVGLLLAVFSLLFFDYVVFAQPTPGGGGGGGSGTNTYPAPTYNYIYVPSLKLVIPSVNESNLYLNLLEADPAGKYDIYFETNLASLSWTDVLQGTNGQTNFVYALSSSDTGFFRAARTDEPVTNTATMTVVFRNDFVNTNLVSATITNGPAARTAILVNSTNFLSAQWLPFSSVPLVLLGTNEGTYEVWFGFVGGDGQTNWTSARVTLDTTPLQLTITSPTNNAVIQPMIQVLVITHNFLSLF